MKILVFDKYLGYNVGGAQRSLHILLSSLPGDVKLLGCEVKNTYNAERFKLNSLSVERFGITEIRRFPYLEYWWNRGKIKKIISQEKADLLITQGLWGAIAVRYFSGKSIFFIRDEYQLNRLPFYQKGWNKFFKFIYLLIQAPFILQMFHDNRVAIKKAIVVANSEYIKRGVENKFARDAVVVYPLMDTSALCALALPPVGQRALITLIGSEYMKGRKVVEAIAARMPDRKFCIVGREFKKSIQKGNVLYEPWCNDVCGIYKRTKILLVPSICAEAFGRTAAEAMMLGIPVVSSGRGGLPELVSADFIIDDVWDIDAWIKKINFIEDNYEKSSTHLKGNLQKFSVDKQIAIFKNDVLSKVL